MARPGSHRCWDSILSYFFSVAEITGGGFAFPGLFQDAVSNDYNPTAIGDTIVLQAGGAHRLGIGAATDHLCTSTDSALCPALDPNEPVSTPAQPAGFFTQSGSAEFNFTLTPVAVPEPGGALLLGAGLALVAARKRG